MVGSVNSVSSGQSVNPVQQEKQKVGFGAADSQTATWGEVIKDVFCMDSKNAYLASAISNDPKSESKKDKLFKLKIAGLVVGALAIAAGGFKSTASLTSARSSMNETFSFMKKGFPKV